MTILIIWSSVRSGSHQLRSMLAQDKGLIDDGEMPIWKPAEFSDFVRKATARKSDSTINLKYGLDVQSLPSQIEAVKAVDDARVLLLHRRDLFAQQASWSYALANNLAFREKAPTSDPIEMSPIHSGRAMFNNALAFHQLSLALPPSMMVEALAYEDITTAKVEKLVSKLLERDVTVTDPTTEKSAPARLADFVINLNPDLKGPNR